ncbi:UvrD/REP helicase [Methanobacterium lacus]|uniref:DNA 3'-5' helicase n=1 Tax=Methanobacterium lacus (strain AL-21) TaxID=877455 RepID=F0T9B7_METLA|nr:ATP-dependent DNA helicase [Methanobacterium lacus]ADZ09868.1 UvrD/REP helicase [Methanobacterium lacus]
MNSICNREDSCTSAQREAAKHFEGPLLIVAGPGAGKTRVLVERVAYLVKKKKVDPSNILVITFTVKAAEELKARLSHCVGQEIVSMQISTIHSFCHEILRDYSDYHELGATFDVLDSEMQLMFMRANFYKLGINRLVNMGRISEVLDGFNKCGENIIPPNELSEHLKKRYPDNKKYQEFCKSYEKYLEALGEQKKIDFAGLQINVLKLLKNNPDVLKAIRDKYRFILVDEYQDTNPIQDEFFDLISNTHKNICVVGDEDQSIYAFRGADPWNFIRFKEKYDSKYVSLDKNFRSTSNIVKLFDGFMENYRSYPKKIEPSRECGNNIIILKSDDVTDEAKNVVRTIKQLKEDGIIPHYGYVALLFRSVRYHANKIIAELKKNDIPYTVKGHGSFLDRKEIQTMLYMLSYVDPPSYDDRFTSWNNWWNISMFETEFLNLNPKTVEALYNLEKDFDISSLLTKQEFVDIGMEDDQDINKLQQLNQLKQELSEKPRTILQTYYDILEISGYLKWLVTDETPKNQEKIYNLAQLSSILNKYEYMNKNPKIKDFMFYLYLLPSGMQYDEHVVDNPFSVNISTVHQSKGLEFPVVFICSVIKNRFPGRKKKEKNLVPIPQELLLKFKKKDLTLLTEDTILPDEFDMEERRLFYVAMTRAQDVLVVSTADKIKVNKVGYSPYVKEIEKIEEVTNSCKFMEMCKDRDLSKEKPISLSYSSIDTYNRCPFMYKMLYEYGFQTPPSYMQNYGIIIHNCLEKIHIGLKNDENIDGSRIKEIVQTCWITLHTNKKKDENQRMMVERNLLDYVHEVKDHSRKIISAEEPFSIVKKNMEINGRTDLILENNQGEIELLDFKAREQMGIEKTSVEFQLKMYEYALKDKYKFDKLCAYTFKDKQKTFFDSKPEDIDELDKNLEKLCDKINEHEFTPKESNFCTHCGFKFCC